MADLASPYPASCYLLPLEKRLRYRDAAGKLDPAAISSASRLVPFASGLNATRKARLGAALGRLQKAMLIISPEGMSPGGMALDESFGFPIVIEVPEGAQRTGTAADGTPWSRTMTGASYGFLPGTCAADREEVDVYRGPVPAAQAPLAFVVSQIGVDPERKLMVGFATAADAIRCYLANVPPEMFGDLHAFPREVIGELLGFEPEAPGALAKALETGTSSTGASVLITKSGATVASFTRVDVDGDATVRKARPIVKAGVILPGKGKPRSLRKSVRDAVESAVLPIQYAAAERLQRAMTSAAQQRAASPALPLRSADNLHPANTAPLSGTYDDPNEVGGWLGWIEDEEETWICFVDVNGMGLLWTARDMDGEHRGAVIGNEPVQIDRSDLARVDLAIETPAPGESYAGPASPERRADLAQEYGTESPHGSTRKAVTLPVRILPITKGLDASTPREKRIVIGVVLEPEPFDGAGDAHDETYSAAEIERAAHAYCGFYRNLNDSHGRFIDGGRAVVVESYIAPCDLVIGGTQIKAGSWILAAKILDDALWGRVLTGELGAWSIEGYAERKPNVGPALAPTMAA